MAKKINVDIEITRQGDGAKKTAEQLEELRKQTEENDKAFEKYQKQAEATGKALEAMPISGFGAEMSKSLAGAGLELANLMILAKTFEMAWQFSMGAAAKQAGGLSAALGAIPKTVQVAIIAEASVQIYQAIKEGLAMMKAEGQAARSEEDGRRNMATYIEPLQKEILELASQGPVGAMKAAPALAGLNIAQTPEMFYTLSEDWSYYLKSNVAYQHFGVKTAQSTLLREQRGSPVNPEASRAESEALQALEQLNAKVQAERLQGLAKERAEAAENYREAMEQIANRAKAIQDSDLREQEVKKAIAEQDATYLGKMQSADKEEAEAQKKRLKELADLKADLTQLALSGLQKEIAREERRYQLVKDTVAAAKDMPAADAKDMLSANDRAHGAAQKSFDLIRPAQEITQFEAGLSASTAASSESRILIIQNEYDARKRFYGELLSSGKITEGGLTQLQEEALQKRTQALGQFVKAGEQEVKRLEAAEKGSNATAVVANRRRYAELEDQVTAYYNHHKELAKDSADEQVRIEREKQKKLDQLKKEEASANSELQKGLKEIRDKSMREFSAGMSHAFMAIVDGSKSAGEAFKEFAKGFLKSLADMIMQLVIFIALKATLKALGVPFGEGGMAVAARGGMFPLTAAAAGVMLAASGLQGVDEVSGPTYFPKFNVLAGEAGREVMTVMARPQMGSVDGMPVMLGNVGSERLAIISQENLSRMVHGSGRATFAASGHMSGGAGDTSLSVSRQASKPDGRIVVELTPHPAYETRIIENSIVGARVAVATDLATDTPIRQQVKGVFS